MKKILSVTQVNKYIKNILELDVILSGVFVQGELSNFKSSGGHFYFTLKDENSSLSCVMFKYNASNLKFTPENGLEVMLFGNVSIYEKTGSMQIYVELMEPYGIGALNLSIEQLKKKLLEKGILNENHKKPIPETITNVALITSPTGAVVHDMIKITKARNNNINLIIIPAIVQGNDAEASIINAIEMTNQYNKIDVIILARGGGSTEDLMPFNTEGVAMAIYYSAIPLISAIGHETDFTISDLVADLRASTPSNAIELCIKESINDLAYIRDLLNTIQYIAQNKI
ncbi:MAG: exodeoxyribonuclease VII large subunit, partial [Defluviitaleaceae bacterium]|nr:exodeoxyribonuclease VII large subunit [Defluviitaleaceae bacterium]